MLKFKIENLKNELEGFTEAVQNKKELQITFSGKTIAQLMPIIPQEFTERPLGSEKGKIILNLSNPKKPARQKKS